MKPIRLQKYLSQAGVAARRKAEVLIAEGRVTVDGAVVTEQGTQVDPEHAAVAVDGVGVTPEDLFYLVLNKPKGCLTTVTDPRGRRTVMEYLPGLSAQVVPVGRLDFYSEGVLLFSNDGDLAAALLSPERHVEKTYHVKVQGTVSDVHLGTLRNGVRLDRRTTTRPAQVHRLKSDSRHDWLVITIIEGKSRQIHRMMEALGYSVQKLQRVAFAGLTFHGLRVGDARELTQGEVKELYLAGGLPRGSRAVSRGKWSARREDSEIARRAAQRERGPYTPMERPQTPGRTAAPKEPRRRPVGGASSGAQRRGATGRVVQEGDRPRRAGKPSRPAQPAPTRPSAPGRSAAAKATRTGKPSRPSQGRPSQGRPSPGKPTGTGKPSRPSQGRPSPGKPTRTGKPSRPSQGRPSPGKPTRTGKPSRPSQGRPSPGKPTRSAKPGSSKRSSGARTGDGRGSGPKRGARGASRGSSGRGGKGPGRSRR